MLKFTLDGEAEKLFEQHRGTLSAELGFSVTAAQMLNWVIKNLKDVRPPTVSVNTALEGQLASHVRSLMSRGKKIDAIRMIRMSTGWSLKESKDWAEKFPYGPKQD